MIELLKERMMTLTASITALVAYAESKGVNILEWLGGLIEAGNEAGAGIYASIMAGAAIIQNYLNQEK